MNCRGVIHEISSYLDGELDAASMAELERHIDHCQDCRLIVDTTRKTIEIFCKTEPLPLAESLRTRLHEALLRRLKRPPAQPS